MHFKLLLIILFSFCSEAIFAQTQKFPYQAVVDADSVSVRSGPGKERYYPTGQLSRGSIVTVYRHDPGGWFSILPPPNSFSWIRSEYVTKISDNQGELNINNVIVRVGSEFSDQARDVEQVRLSKGHRVTILGQQDFQTERGTISLYKIKPPAGEWRWISGRYLVPLDPQRQQEHDNDPFNVPFYAKSSSSQTSPAQNQTEAIPLKRTASQTASALPISENQQQPATFVNDPKAEFLAKMKQQATQKNVQRTQQVELEKLDQRFREMVKLQISEWDLQSIQQAYQTLSEQAVRPLLSRKIVLRLQAVTRYQKLETEYQEFLKLASETDEREAELRSRQLRYSSKTKPQASSTTQKQPTPATPISSSSEPSTAEGPQLLPLNQ